MIADKLLLEYFKGFESITVLATHPEKQKRLVKRVHYINDELVLRFKVIKFEKSISHTTAAFGLETDDLDYAIQVYNSI